MGPTGKILKKASKKVYMVNKMNKEDVQELRFITFISNNPSIQSVGILSRNEIKRKGMKFEDISDQGVQERRANKKIPGTAKYLHDYANLYFDAHNPMLSARRSDNVAKEYDRQIDQMIYHAPRIFDVGFRPAG